MAAEHETETGNDMKTKYGIAVKREMRLGSREGTGGKSAVRLWMQFLEENRTVLLLYFMTVLLFVMTCCLYHIENVDKLLYASLMTFALWAGAGILHGIRYVRKRRALEAAERAFEQCSELNLKEIRAGADTVESDEQPRTVEQQFIQFLTIIDENRSREQSEREEKEADRRDYFLMWAHQIKTPIAAMKLLLEEAGDCENNFRMREELFKIEQYAEMVLTIQRLENMAADLVLQEYALVPLLRQAVRKYSVLFINKGLQVEVSEEECRVLTDEKWFSFCLEQVLSNAVKYTEKGKITLGIKRQDASGEHPEEGERENCVVLYIEDTGMGIRTEDLPRIFDKGFTGYNGRVDKRATGIGLYLCKSICRQLGVTIRVESRFGVGTRVELAIPISGSRHAFS